jgi:hypothetical protein
MLPEEPLLPDEPPMLPEEPLVPLVVPPVAPLDVVPDVPDAALDFLALRCFFFDFFFGAVSVLASVLADWPEVAAGPDEVELPAAPGDPMEPVLPAPEVPVVPEALEVLLSLLEGAPLIPLDEPEEPVPLVLDAPEVSDGDEVPDALDDGVLLEPDEEEDGVAAEEPLAAPVAASLLGLLVPLTEGEDAEGLLLSELDPMLEPDACASTTDDADAIRTNDSVRSVVFNVMSNSFN